MKKQIFALALVLSLLGCGNPPAQQHLANVDSTPGLKRPVQIFTPYGHDITCTAGIGAVCVQQ